jgi:hypothetical protein
MDDDDAARLIAGSRLIAGDLNQLGYGLSRLRPDHSGYITAEDYARITGEELDEFSTEGRKTMADPAAQHGCTIQTPPIERRVYFAKAK